MKRNKKNKGGKSVDYAIDENTAKKALRGKEGFEQWYSSLFSSRWEELKKAFLSENVYSELGEKEKYFLDPASVFAAFQLPLNEGGNFLDLCAAPGGKSLVIANRMDEESRLTSNERSSARKTRLDSVLKASLSEERFSRVKTCCSDGALWCKKYGEEWDSILLDAPCSSERHVYNDEKYLSQWSASRIKTLSMEQWKLISSAWRMLKNGGYLLYSTCALSPEENDLIIERLIKKFPEAHLVFGKLDEKEEKAAVEKSIISSEKSSSLFINKTPSFPDDLSSSFVKMPFIPVPERTPLGFHILPDKNNGSGPIWFTLLQKKASLLHSDED